MLLSFFNCTTKDSKNTGIPIEATDITPLLIGEQLPDAQVYTPDGEMIHIQDILSQKPTVLVFYRGGRCPYCNMQLSELAHIEQQIIDLDYQIVAISPDDYKNLYSTHKKDDVHYQLYSDPNGKFIQDIGIAFQTGMLVKGYIHTQGQKGDIAEAIPVPTVMIVDKEGKILFEYINPNYQERLSSKMLIAVLKNLKK